MIAPLLSSIIGLLDLPVEVRLNVYQYLFRSGKVLLDGGYQGEEPYLISGQGSIHAAQRRSGQILRTCRTIFVEAEPLLYASTHFIILHQAFAGRLPRAFNGGSLIAPRIQHLTWQLSCDFLRHLYMEDVKISKEDMSNVRSLELRCQAESWKGSLCGALTDEQAIVRGREDLLRYAKRIQKILKASRNSDVFVVEDSSQQDRGKLIVRILRTTPILEQHELIHAD